MLRRWIEGARRRRWVNVVVVNLRIFLGFAFVPAGLKKVLDQPFTDPANTGAFHEFLHAFHDTGPFYQVVGSLQLVAACLLMTQRFATLGALVMTPIVTAILALCWSTAGLPTCIVVTLMFLGLVGLLLWDVDKWRGVFRSDRRGHEIRIEALPPVIDLSLWQRCGAGVLALYLAVCALTGGIYRPEGVELDTPTFYLFPVMLLFPIVTFVVDQRRHRRART